MTSFLDFASRLVTFVVGSAKFPLPNKRRASTRSPGDGVARAAERLRLKQIENKKIPDGSRWTRQRERQFTRLMAKGDIERAQATL